MFAEKRVNPRKICNLGFSEKVKFFLKNINIKGSVQKTVKKYLAQVIWKKDNSADKYFAMVSIKGKTAHADKLRIIALIKKNTLMLWRLWSE